MNYPSLAEVEIATIEQLCRWSRFLPPTGLNSFGKVDYDKIMDQEVKIMARILERQKELGGMTPQISKRIGWKP